MKLFTTITLSVIALGLLSAYNEAHGAPGNQGTSVNRSMMQADFAEIMAFEPNGVTDVIVYQDKAGNDRDTFLQVYSSSCSSTEESFTCTSMMAMGNIPEGDFVSSHDSADLLTDTSNLSGYSVEYGCDYDTWTCHFNDLPFVGGVIDLSWEKNSVYSFKNEGRTEQDMLDFKFIQQGKFSFSSASVEGFVFGAPVAQDAGRMGEAMSVSLFIDKTH